MSSAGFGAPLGEGSWHTASEGHLPAGVQVGATAEAVLSRDEGLGINPITTLEKQLLNMIVNLV
jgi:hypothetical protein